MGDVEDIRSARMRADNGVADALTDGLVILRHLFTLTGATLTQNAVGAGANRNTAALIEPYLQTLEP